MVSAAFVRAVTMWPGYQLMDMEPVEPTPRGVLGRVGDPLHSKKAANGLRRGATPKRRAPFCASMCESEQFP